jgi:hypothetical protein
MCVLSEVTWIRGIKTYSDVRVKCRHLDGSWFIHVVGQEKAILAFCNPVFVPMRTFTDKTMLPHNQGCSDIFGRAYPKKKVTWRHLKFRRTYWRHPKQKCTWGAGLYFFKRHVNCGKPEVLYMHKTGKSKRRSASRACPPSPAGRSVLLPPTQRNATTSPDPERHGTTPTKPTLVVPSSPWKLLPQPHC